MFDDLQKLVHWQYVHGLDIEPVYWLAGELSVPQPLVVVRLVIEYVKAKRSN